VSQPPKEITCIECGGTAHLLSYVADDEDTDLDGLALAYRCSDCMDRFDVIWEEGDAV